MQRIYFVLELGARLHGVVTALGPRRGTMNTITTASLDYQRITEAFVHPLKLRMLALMAEPPPSRVAAEGSREPGWSPSSLYLAVGAPLGNVSYHVRQLEKAGLIELVGSKQRRGAIEHYYYTLA